MTDTVKQTHKGRGHPPIFNRDVEICRIECYPMSVEYKRLLRELGRQVTGKPNVTAGVRYLCQLYLERTNGSKENSHETV